LDDESYATIRDPHLLGAILGATVLDVTQHDKEEFDEDGSCYFEIHFSNGVTLNVPVGDDGVHLKNIPDDSDD
jgi:hypothetical protein